MFGSTPAFGDRGVTSREFITSRRRCRTSSTVNVPSSNYSYFQFHSCLSKTLVITFLLSTGHLSTCGASHRLVAFTSPSSVKNYDFLQQLNDNDRMGTTVPPRKKRESSFSTEVRRRSRGGMSTSSSSLCFHFGSEHSELDAALSSTTTFLNRLFNMKLIRSSSNTPSSSTSHSRISVSRWSRKSKGRNLKSSSTAQRLNLRNDLRADLIRSSEASYSSRRRRQKGVSSLDPIRKLPCRKTYFASLRSPQEPISCRVPPLSSLMMGGTNNDFSSENDLNSTNTKQQKLIKKSKPPLTEEDYQQTKNAWAAKYTSLSTLRSQFGTNRNRLWGDFDMSTSRKLYHTLLPRALLGLYEMGLWRVQDLAPLAFEARIAAKKYARERCVVPGRIMAMVYDGWRSWRDWGTWNMEGMSWEQIWFKYETQILEEYMDDAHELDVLYGENSERLTSNLLSGKATGERLMSLGGMTANELQEEITAQICFRILEKSCTTNASIDKLLLQDLKDSPEFKTRNRGKRKKRILRRRNAERDIARIATKLERDMQDLLESNKQLQFSSYGYKSNQVSAIRPNFLDLVGGSLSISQSGSTALSVMPCRYSMQHLIEFSKSSPWIHNKAASMLRSISMVGKRIEKVLLPFSITCENTQL